MRSTSHRRNPRPFTPSRRVALALMGAGGLSACVPAGPAAVGGPAGPAIDPTRPVPVALLTPGGAGDLAQLSADLEVAARLGAARGGARLDIFRLDTGGSGAGAQAAVRQAADRGAAIVLGPLFAEAAAAAGVVAAQSGLSVLSFSNNTAVAGGNVYVLGATFENTARRLLTYGRRQGRDRIVVTAPVGAAGDAAVEAVSRAASASRARVVSNVRYALGQADIAASGPRIAEAIRAAQADTLVLTADPAGALPFIANAVAEAGIAPPEVQFIGLTRWDASAEVLALPALQGGWFATADPGRTATFAQAFQAAAGRAPHPIAYLGYDAALAVSTLVASGGDVGARALTRGQGFEGATGGVRLLRDGTNARALAIQGVEGGRAVLLDPAGRPGAGF